MLAHNIHLLVNSCVWFCIFVTLSHILYYFFPIKTLRVQEGGFPYFVWSLFINNHWFILKLLTWFCYRNCYVLRMLRQKDHNLCLRSFYPVREKTIKQRKVTCLVKQTIKKEGAPLPRKSAENFPKADILEFCTERWVGICQADRILVKVKGEWGWGTWKGI